MLTAVKLSRPVVKPATIRTVLSLDMGPYWPIHLLDVKNAFLHCHLQEIVYMHQPPVFYDPSFPNHVCLLQKSQYGLKLALRAWFHRFATHLVQIGFVNSICDSSLLIYKDVASGMAYFLVYVDDIILIASINSLLQHLISHLQFKFAMIDLVTLSYFLGISVTRFRDSMFLSQSQYALDILSRAQMTNCKSIVIRVDTEAKLGNNCGPQSRILLYIAVLLVFFSTLPSPCRYFLCCATSMPLYACTV